MLELFSETHRRCRCERVRLADLSRLDTHEFPPPSPPTLNRTTHPTLPHTRMQLNTNQPIAASLRSEISYQFAHKKPSFSRVAPHKISFLRNFHLINNPPPRLATTSNSRSLLKMAGNITYLITGANRGIPPFTPIYCMELREILASLPFSSPAPLNSLFSLSLSH